METTAITPVQFENWCKDAGLVPGERVAIAVSGGVDSIALLVLAAPLFDVLAITVDHGLRPTSHEDVLLVRALCKKIGVKHRLVHWQGDKPASNIQARAREARYDLLVEACRQAGVPKLLTGHHSDDQAETFILRLMRGSGLRGLAGMAVRRPLAEDVELVRPLLHARRSQLEAVAVQHQLDWVEDESNRNTVFERVRVRAFLKSASLPELTVERLTLAADNLARAQAAIDFYVRQAFDKHVKAYPQAGWYHVDGQLLEPDHCPREVALRLISALVQHVGGADYGPRLKDLEEFVGRLAAQDSATLAGVQAGPYCDTSGTSGFFLCREAAMMATRDLAKRPLGEGCEAYDGTWQAEMRMDRGILGPLGEDGWVSVKADIPSEHVARRWPHAVRRALPAVRSDGSILYVAALESSREDGSLWQKCDLIHAILKL